MSLSAVAQYTVPRVPPENPWIDRTKAKTKSRAATPSPAPATAPTAPSASTSTSTSASTPANASAGPSSCTGSGSSSAPASASSSGKRRRPPSRRLIRHVLRAHVEAAKALASLFAQLDRAPDGKRVCAAMHLARAFGGGVDHGVDALERESPDGVAAVPEPQGWRHAREVVTFLRAHGARFRALETPVEGDWAALSSDGDGDESEGVSTSEKDDIVWVPSSQH